MRVNWSLQHFTEEVGSNHHLHGIKEDSNTTCKSSLIWMIESWEGEEEVCKKFRVDLIDGFAIKASAILSAFVIEYVLIGTCMAFLMYRHVGT